MATQPTAQHTPAFPQNEFSAYTVDREGMSLRDWFATHALTFGIDWCHEHETGGYAEAAQVAYEIADAMLAERAKATGAA